VRAAITGTMGMDLDKKLRVDGLRKVGRIDCVRGAVTAEVTARACNWHGGVYAWVALNKKGKPLRVRYVGRHSKSLIARCKEHSNGFRRVGGSKTGQKNAGKILADLNQDVASFAIYGTHSGEPKSLELYLMKRYHGKHPTLLWNVSGMKKIARELGL
jgi:hypothetical protein